MQQQVEFRCFLEFFDRVDGNVEVRSRYDWAVIGEQYRMMLAGEAAHRFGEREIAGAKIGNKRQTADPHHVISRDRRQDVFRVDFGEARNRDRMRRMQMHDRTGRGPLLIHHAVQEALFGRRIARDEAPVMAQLRQPRRVEAAERGVGRRHQPAVVSPHADVSGRPGGQPARKDRLANRADRLALRRLAHLIPPSDSTEKARRKKSGAPKLPDLSANARAGSPRLMVQGTPGSICRPMRKPVTPSAWTIAPAVSPPAMTNRRAPFWTRPAAIVASVSSTNAPARSRPTTSWIAATSSGGAVALIRMGRSPSHGVAQASASSAILLPAAAAIGSIVKSGARSR